MAGAPGMTGLRPTRAHCGVVSTCDEMAAGPGKEPRWAFRQRAGRVEIKYSACCCTSSSCGGVRILRGHARLVRLPRPRRLHQPVANKEPMPSAGPARAPNARAAHGKQPARGRRGTEGLGFRSTISSVIMVSNSNQFLTVP